MPDSLEVNYLNKKQYNFEDGICLFPNDLDQPNYKYGVSP